jgi:exopolysaccharide production protein ExoQ
MLSQEPAVLASASTDPGSLHIRSTPIHFYVLSWILIVPVLFFATNTSPSLLNHDNSEFMTANSGLTQMKGGVRPEAIAFYLFMMGLMVLGRYEVISAIRKNPVLVLSGPLLAAASALWSGSPYLSFRAALDLAFATGLACYLSERFSSEHLMRFFAFVGAVAAALSIGLALLLPSYGLFQRYGGGAWQGIFSHKNGLGVTMAILLTPMFFLQRPMRTKLTYAAVLLGLVVLSQSRTAWFVTAGILTFVAWEFLFRRLRGIESVALSAIAIALACVLITAAVSHLAAFMTVIGKDPTMTGRTLIYQLVIEAILKHPLGGYGYGAFWFGATQESRNIATQINWPSIGYAENGFLELGLELGLCGIAVAIGIMGRAVCQGIMLLKSPLYRPQVGWLLSLVIGEFLINIDAGNVMAPGNLTWVLTLVGAIGLANETRRIHSICA